MNILLTGASGQLGGALARALESMGEVTAPGRRELDLAGRFGTIRNVVLRLRPDLVVNAAAYTAVDEAETEVEQAMAVNAMAPEALATAARDCGAAIVHYSTDYVFDGGKAAPYTEDDVPQPLNRYGASKLAGERAVALSGAPHLILRTSWLYGASGHNFLNTMLELGAERRLLRVVDDQVGAPTSVGVVAAVTATILAEAGDAGRRSRIAAYLAERGGLYHVACQGQTTWHGFALAIFEEAQRRRLPLEISTVRAVSSVDYPTPAERPANSRLDMGRLKARFGLETPDWREALAAVFDEIMENQRPSRHYLPR